MSTVNTSSWGCIESLSNPLNTQNPQVYVHPLDKRWTSMLSDKSLEMCTESLGSETGSDIIDEDIFSIMSSSPDSDQESRRTRKPMRKMEAKKAGYENIPPPLTILRGVNSVHVEPVREEGRLVINVVSTSPRKSSVVARRSNGRLTMELVEDVELMSEEDEERVDEIELVEFDGEGEVEEGVEQDCDDEKELKNLVVAEEGKNGISVEVGGKLGIKKLQKPRGCKDSEHVSRRLIKLETFWVA